jgi:hypothetical protein
MRLAVSSASRAYSALKLLFGLIVCPFRRHPTHRLFGEPRGAAADRVGMVDENDSRDVTNVGASRLFRDVKPRGPPGSLSFLHLPTVERFINELLSEATFGRVPRSSLASARLSRRGQIQGSQRPPANIFRYLLPTVRFPAPVRAYRYLGPSEQPRTGDKQTCLYATPASG